MIKSTSWATMFASVQWFFFIFANIVVVPVSIGLAFDLPSAEVVSMLRCSLIVTGIACILQGMWGHRLPLMEGPSGVIWGLILTLSLSAPSLGLSLSQVGGGIATGMILAGIFTILMVFFNLIPYIQKIFTPMVLSVYLFLLTFHLILVFFKGMLQINDDGSLNLSVTVFSIGVALVVGVLKVKGKKAIGNFSILIGMVGGWILYNILFKPEAVVHTVSSSSFSIFPLGSPNLQYGIIIITFIGCLINLSNTIASVQAASKLLNKNVEKSQYQRSYLLTGTYSIVAGMFGLVTYAPFASSIGFLESTQIFRRMPFFIGGALISILGLIPTFAIMLSRLPITVGSAVLFVAYLQLFGTSIKSLNGYAFNSITIHRLAAPVLIGVSLMTVDTKLFSQLPAWIQPLISNGFIMGVLISIMLESTMKWDKVVVNKQQST